MNKFETNLLQTLSSIDESLKVLAGRTQPPAAPAKKPAKPLKTATNGALPKVMEAKPAKGIEKGGIEKGKG